MYENPGLLVSKSRVSQSPSLMFKGRSPEFRRRRDVHDGPSSSLSNLTHVFVH